MKQQNVEVWQAAFRRAKYKYFVTLFVHIKQKHNALFKKKVFYLLPK